MNDSSNSNTTVPVKENFLQQSFSAFLHVLLKRWWILGLAGLLGGIGGVFYAMKKKPVYESNLTFVLDEGSGGSGMTGAITIAAQLGVNLGGGNEMFSGDNICEIIRSRRIVEQVLLTVDTFGKKPFTLVEYFLQLSKVKNKKGKEVHFFPGSAKGNLTYAQDSVLFLVYEGLVKNNIESDRPNKKLDIFSVRVSSPDEQFTKVFTDRLMSATDSFYTEICSKKSRETLQILERRVAEMRGNLNTSISQRAATQDANLNPAFAASEVPVIKYQTNMQVYGGAYAEMFKNLEIAQFQHLKKIPLIQIIDRADYPMKKVKASKIKTGLLFAIGLAALLVFFFWIRRIYNIGKAETGS